MADREFDEVSILVCSGDPKKFRLVMRQISNMGMTCAAVGNVKKALQYIVANKPTHMFLSVNIPKMNAVKVAKLLSTTFNLPVILYPEDFGYKTSKYLKDVGWNNVMHSSFSGPSVTNMIRLMRKRELGEDTSALEEENNSAAKSGSGRRPVDSDDGENLYAKRKKKGRPEEDDGGDSLYAKRKKPRLRDEDENEGEDLYVRKARASRRSREELDGYEDEDEDEDYDDDDWDDDEAGEVSSRRKSKKTSVTSNESLDDEYYDDDEDEEGFAGSIGRKAQNLTDSNEEDDSEYRSKRKRRSSGAEDLDDDDDYEEFESVAEGSQEDHENFDYEDYDEEDETGELVSKRRRRKKRKLSRQEDSVAEEDDFFIDDEEDDDDDLDLASLMKTALAEKAKQEDSIEDEDDDDDEENFSSAGKSSKRKSKKNIQDDYEELSENELEDDSEYDYVDEEYDELDAEGNTVKKKRRKKRKKRNVEDEDDDLIGSEDNPEEDYEDDEEYDDEDDDLRAFRKKRKKRKKKPLSDQSESEDEVGDQILDVSEDISEELEFLDEEIGAQGKQKKKPSGEGYDEDEFDSEDDDDEDSLIAKKKRKSKSGNIDEDESSDSVDFDEDQFTANTSKLAKKGAAKEIPGDTEDDDDSAELESKKKKSYSISENEKKNSPTRNKDESIGGRLDPTSDESKSDWDLRSKAELKKESYQKFEGAITSAISNIANKKEETQVFTSPTRSMVVFAAKGDHFEGYLILAAGKDNIVASELAGPFRKKLMVNLKETGFPLELYDPFFIQTETIKYEAMMGEMSQLTIMSTHMGEEVGISFVEADKSYFEAKYTKRAGKSMYKVSLDSVEPGVPVEMDMYLYLPNNDRYVKYVGEGGTLEKDQIDKLREREIDDFSVEDKDIRNWRQQAASDYLNKQFNKDSNVKKKVS